MIDAFWKHNHVALLAVDPDPSVFLVSDVKVACANTSPDQLDIVAPSNALNPHH